MGIVTDKIHEGKAPPVNVVHARKYPDHHGWAEAYDTDIQKLNDEKVIEWTKQGLSGTKEIPLTMEFKCKCGSDGSIKK